MDTHQLTVTARTGVGNGPSKVLRREGRIPAILYGPKTKTLHLSVDALDMGNLLKKGPVGQLLIDLKVGNGRDKPCKAMVKELQVHPVNQKLIHVDFYEISMDRKIRVSIPVIPMGTSQGVELGGILQVVRRELEVLCLPSNIPESIEVDVTELNIGDSLHIEEVELPKDIEIVAESNFTIVTVISAQAEEEEVVEEEEELEEGEGEGEETAEADEGEGASSES